MSNHRSVKNAASCCLVALGVLALTAASAPAMSGTDHVAGRGHLVSAELGWPEGVLDLVNDPLRTEGWCPWFSEWPNDVKYYAFEVGGTNDLNHLIEKLAAIKCPKKQIVLRPDTEPRVLAFTTVLKEGNAAAAVFSIGNQQRLNEWYERLTEGEPGVRIFGVHRLRKPPEALLPTLTLYAGNKAVALDGLKIPAGVEVSASVSAADRAEEKNAAAIKAIDDFMAKGPAKPARSLPDQPESSKK